MLVKTFENNVKNINTNCNTKFGTFIINICGITIYSLRYIILPDKPENSL